MLGIKERQTELPTNEFKRLNKVIEIVKEAKTCCSSAYYMAKDLQYLYASDKYFYTLPHQFSFTGFDLSDTNQVRKKAKKIQISYHGRFNVRKKYFCFSGCF